MSCLIQESLLVCQEKLILFLFQNVLYLKKEAVLLKKRKRKPTTKNQKTNQINNIVDYVFSFFSFLRSQTSLLLIPGPFHSLTLPWLMPVIMTPGPEDAIQSCLFLLSLRPVSATRWIEEGTEWVVPRPSQGRWHPLSTAVWFPQLSFPEPLALSSPQQPAGTQNSGPPLVMGQGC